MNKNIGLKNDDIQAVRKCFYKGGVWTKNKLSRETGLSLASMTNVLQGLMNEGEILYISDAASTGGRRSKQYILNEDYAHIGMVICRRDRDRYYFELYSCSLAGGSVCNRIIVSETGSVGELKESITWLEETDPLIRVFVVSIPGVCVQGVVSLCDFHLFEGQNLGFCIPEWSEWVIENDVNVACIGFAAEYKNVRNTALVFQPSVEYTGVGLLVNGRLYNGSSHMAGELRLMADEKPVNELENPADGLWKDILAVQAVMDPEMVGWSSDIVHEKDLEPYCKDSKVCLKHIEDVDALIRLGMYRIGMDVLLNKGREEEV